MVCSTVVVSPHESSACSPIRAQLLVFQRSYRLGNRLLISRIVRWNHARSGKMDGGVEAAEGVLDGGGVPTGEQRMQPHKGSVACFSAFLSFRE